MPWTHKSTNVASSAAVGSFGSGVRRPIPGSNDHIVFIDDFQHIDRSPQPLIDWSEYSHVIFLRWQWK